MIVFLDFEASSLSKTSYPIEVAWVFEDGRSAACLIKPAPQWDDWDPASEAIHHISRDELVAQGCHHEMVAQTMLNDLVGHDLRASAPSWDGKWLSTLLRASGLPIGRLPMRAMNIADGSRCGTPRGIGSEARRAMMARHSSPGLRTMRTAY